MTAEEQGGSGLYEDDWGALPRPWIAFRLKEDSQNQWPATPWFPYYYVNSEQPKWCQWERPKVHIRSEKVYQFSPQRSLFENWKEHPGKQELRAITATEAHQVFREHCTHLCSWGQFRRRQDSILWRLGEAEHMGILLQPGSRTLSICYDPGVVQWQDLSSLESAILADSAAAAAGPGGTAGQGMLSLGAKLQALRAIQRACVAQRPLAEASSTVEAQLVQRYIAEVAMLNAPEPCPLPRLTQEPSNGAEDRVAEAAALTEYLSSFDLILPAPCMLTGLSVSNFVATERELATHLISGPHRERRSILRNCVSSLRAMRRQDAHEKGHALPDWLPANALEYRKLFEWCDKREQEIPMVDGRVFRFDHLTGTGVITPKSNWKVKGQVPPALAADSPSEAARLPLATDAVSEARHHQMAALDIWSQGPMRDQPQVAIGIDELVFLTNVAVHGEPHPPEGIGMLDYAADNDQVDPPWQKLYHKQHPYYHNHETGECQWEKPARSIPVKIDGTWATTEHSKSRKTSWELKQRYHGFA